MVAGGEKDGAATSDSTGLLGFGSSSNGADLGSVWDPIVAGTRDSRRVDDGSRRLPNSGVNLGGAVTRG